MSDDKPSYLRLLHDFEKVACGAVPLSPAAKKAAKAAFRQGLITMVREGGDDRQIQELINTLPSIAKNGELLHALDLLEITADCIHKAAAEVSTDQKSAQAFAALESQAADAWRKTLAEYPEWSSERKRAKAALVAKGASSALLQQAAEEVSEVLSSPFQEAVFIYGADPLLPAEKETFHQGLMTLVGESDDRQIQELIETLPSIAKKGELSRALGLLEITADCMHRAAAEVYFADPAKALTFGALESQAAEAWRKTLAEDTEWPSERKKIKALVVAKRASSLLLQQAAVDVRQAISPSFEEPIADWGAQEVQGYLGQFRLKPPS